MAYGVFNNSDKNSLFRLCKDLTELNEKPLSGSETSGEIPDDVFNDLISERKDIFSIVNGVVTTSDHVENMPLQEFIQYRGFLIEGCEKFIANNPSSVMNSKITAYINALNTLEVTNMTFPLTKSINQYLLDNGIVQSEEDLFILSRLC